VKKFLVSLSFVLAGSLMWWGLSNIVKFSVKKWDAKLDTALRYHLSELGVSNKNILSSVNEIKSDSQGDYVLKRISLKGLSTENIHDLTEKFQQVGADVQMTALKNKQILEVKKGSRLYQEITFVK